MVQTVSVVGSVVTNSGWIGLASIAVAFLVGLLLWHAYCKTNTLQKELIQLTREQHEWQMEMKNPKLLYRNAMLKKIASSRAFVIELELLNPGEIPIQIETAICSLDGGTVAEEDYTRKRRQPRTAEPRTPYKTDLTIITSRAQDPQYWPSIARVTLKYVSARTKLFTFSFAVHPRSESEAFLMITHIEGD